MIDLQNLFPDIDINSFYLFSDICCCVSLFLLFALFMFYKFLFCLVYWVLLDHSYQDANRPWTDYGVDYCVNDFDLVATNT